MMEVLEKQNFEEVTSAPQTTRRTTTEVIRIPTTKKRLKTENEYGLKTYRGPCNCSKLIMTSNNPTTISKHGAELGQYILIGGLSGRPVYKHIHRSFFLFYQPESGGNWLVNTRPGLMYGGIQNSKVTLMNVNKTFFCHVPILGLSSVSIPSVHCMAVWGQ